MLKKTITYKDYNGVEHTEDFYFNLNKAEITELEMSKNGGMSGLIEQIINTRDNAKIVQIFKEIILMSYGQKSIDGKRFIKSDALREEFEQSEAYSELFMELATDADAGAKFINAIIPAQLAEEIKAPVDTHVTR